jgi:hypothetical protein
MRRMPEIGRFLVTSARLPHLRSCRVLRPALARAFKIVDGNLKNPATEHWQKCFGIFDLLM